MSVAFTLTRDGLQNSLLAVLHVGNASTASSLYHTTISCIYHTSSPLSHTPGSISPILWPRVTMCTYDVPPVMSIKRSILIGQQFIWV